MQLLVKHVQVGEDCLGSETINVMLDFTPIQVKTMENEGKVLTHNEGCCIYARDVVSCGGSRNRKNLNTLTLGFSYHEEEWAIFHLYVVSSLEVEIVLWLI